MRAVLLLLVLGTSAAAPGVAGAAEGGEPSAEIAIGLPAGQAPRVAVTVGTDQVLVELPRGARFPSEFSASTGGLLRGGSAREHENGVELELELGRGLLRQVVYGPERVLLRFVSRVDDARPEPGEEAEAYRIGVDDRVAIRVHNHPNLATELVVTSEGLISAPLVGDVIAAGLSPRELSAKLTTLLGRDFLVDPQVDVEVIDYRSQWVILSGEVGRPGRVPLRGGTRLKEAVGDVAGFTVEAGEEILITRSSATGQPKTIRVERTAFERGETNPVLRHGDVIEVPRADYCYIQGEVETSNRVRIERGMTLLRVIALAGGLTEWANRKEVKVLYPEGTVPRERVFNLNKIEKGKVADPAMEGGEVIIVKRRFL